MTEKSIFDLDDVIPTLRLVHAAFAEGGLVAEVLAGQNRTPGSTPTPFGCCG